MLLLLIVHDSAYSKANLLTAMIIKIMILLVGQKEWPQNCLSAHIVKTFIFPSDPIFRAMNFGEKYFDFDKSDFFMNF